MKDCCSNFGQYHVIPQTRHEEYKYRLKRFLTRKEERRETVCHRM